MEGGWIVWHIIALIGAIKIATHFLPWLYWKLFCGVNLNRYKYGYVLITGASDGIGKSMSKEFARRGFNLILVARNQSKLEIVKQEIQSLYPIVNIELIQCDFAESHRDPSSFYKNLCAELSKFEISVLINNVGAVDPNNILKVSYEKLEQVIGVNIYPTVMLSHHFIPKFLERKKNQKKKSMIINFSSVIEEIVLPGATAYKASKRYITFLTKGLEYEYPEIDFVLVKPGPVVTNMLYEAGMASSPMKVTCDRFAKDLIGGLRTGTNYGTFKHKIVSSNFRLLNYLTNIWVVRGINSIASQGS